MIYTDSDNNKFVRKFILKKYLFIFRIISLNLFNDFYDLITKVIKK